MLAVECNDLASVKALIEKGADVNAKNKSGMTALIPAALRGVTEVARSLLDAGAHIDETWNEGEAALSEAAAQGHDSTIELLFIIKTV